MSREELWPKKSLCLHNSYLPATDLSCLLCWLPKLHRHILHKIKSSRSRNKKSRTEDYEHWICIQIFSIQTVPYCWAWGWGLRTCSFSFCVRSTHFGASGIITPTDLARVHYLLGVHLAITPKCLSKGESLSRIAYSKKTTSKWK